MPPNLLKYSNGWGHLLMSIVLIVAGVILILQPAATVQAVGIGLIGTVVPYWFISSSANAIQQRQATAQPPAQPTPPEVK